MEETIPEEQGSQIKSNHTSHEPFFGMLVMMIIMVLLVALASYGGWFLYHGVKNSRDNATLLSIENIPMATNTIGDEKKEETLKPIEDKDASSEKVAVNKKIAIKVLNGGAIKGSAGVASDILKSAGYTTISTGNSTGDYTGVLISFASPANQGDADSVKESLSKKYPLIVVKPVVQGNADMAGSPITVIVGR